MSKEKIINCSECKYMKGHRKGYTQKNMFECLHPDREYITKCFDAMDSDKKPGLIGLYKGLHPAISRAPRWCPIKRTFDLGGE